jgi:hypothetical protein
MLTTRVHAIPALIVATVIFKVFVVPVEAAEGKKVDAEKPLVIYIYNKGCDHESWNRTAYSTFEAARKTYGDRVDFHKLDISKPALQASLKKAKKLGIEAYLVGAVDMTPEIGVFTYKRRLSKEIVGLKPPELLKHAIEKVLSQEDSVRK